jgi:hypothetical protein
VNRDRRLLWIIVAIALILRIAASWVWQDRLDEDIDGYRCSHYCWLVFSNLLAATPPLRRFKLDWEPLPFC